MIFKFLPILEIEPNYSKGMLKGSKGYRKSSFQQAYHVMVQSTWVLDGNPNPEVAARKTMKYLYSVVSKVT
jgi:hypothetical protein